MGQDEKPVGIYRADIITLKDQSGVEIPHDSGHVKLIMSGSKLELSTGSKWETVTSS